MKNEIYEGVNYLADNITSATDKNYFYAGRLRYIDTLKLVPRLDRESRILDVGSGYGHISILVKKIFGYDVYAIDHASTAAGRLNSFGVKFKECDLISEDLPFEDNYFDIAIFSEVIEHLFVPPQKVLYEIRRVLKPGGKIIVRTPNLYSLLKRVRFLMGKRIIERFSKHGDTAFSTGDLEGYGKFHLAMQHRLHGCHDFGGTHVREYDMPELKALLNESGFLVLKAVYPGIPVFFNEFSGKLDLVPYRVAYRF